MTSSRPALALVEAQRRLLALATPLPAERRPIADAVGRYLVDPVHARRSQPGADLSAMDGYAVGTEAGPGPWRVAGESAAGRPFRRPIAPGEAIRIATGALIPEGACRVLLQEDTKVEAGMLALAIAGGGSANRHIRCMGSDFHAGELLVQGGTRLTARHVALIISGGVREVAVRRRATVAVIDSGDELVADGEECSSYQIPASNGAMIRAMLAGLPCDVRLCGPVPDNAAALTAAFDAAGDADIVVTSGGASVGDHDLIRPVLAGLGAHLDFWRVQMKPGKPMLVACRDAQLILGLPGNPVASYVTAYFFLIPLIKAMLGSESPIALSTPYALTAPMRAGGTRVEFLRGRRTAGGVEPLPSQDSAGLVALARAEILIERAAGAAAADIGAIVPAFPIHPA